MKKYRNSIALIKLKPTHNPRLPPILAEKITSINYFCNKKDIIIKLFKKKKVKFSHITSVIRYNSALLNFTTELSLKNTQTLESPLLLDDFSGTVETDEK